MRNGLPALGGGESSGQIRMSTHLYSKRKVCNPIFIGYKLIIRGGILGCNLPNKASCTIDRENHIYLFDLGTYHDALDLDLYNFQFVWDDVLGNMGVTFTMKYEYTSERIIGGVGRDIIWKEFKLNLPYKLHSKRELIIDKIKEAMIIFGLDGDIGWIPKYKIEFDF